MRLQWGNTFFHLFFITGIVYKSVFKAVEGCMLLIGKKKNIIHKI